MAVFYWVGGSVGITGTYNTLDLGDFTGKTGAENLEWVRAFDWNNPLNWRTINSSGTTYSSQLTNRCPGNGDDAIFGTPFSITTPNGLTGDLFCYTPCLWGGVSVNGVTLTWMGAGVSGTSGASTTNNISLEHFTITGYAMSQNQPTVYKNRWIGGGYGQGSFFESSVPSGSTAWGTVNSFGFYNSWHPGSTWSTVTRSECVAALAATGGNSRYQELKIKVKDFNSGPEMHMGTYSRPGDSPSGNYGNPPIVSVTILPSFTTLAGTCGGSASSWCRTQATVSGVIEYRFNNSVLRNLWREGAVSSWNQGDSNLQYNSHAPKPSLLLNGGTYGKITIINRVGSVLVTPSTNISKLEVTPTDQKYLIQLQNSFNRAAVESYLGEAVSGTAAYNPNIDIKHYSLIDTQAYAEPYFSGVWIGTPGSTSTISDVRIGYGSLGSTLPNSTLSFVGSAVIPTLETWKTTTNAEMMSGNFDATRIEIENFYFKHASVLDLRKNNGFDNWYFGKWNGVSMEGGIIFENGYGSYAPTILGSMGVRFWNDQYIGVRSSSLSQSQRLGYESSQIGNEFI